VCVSLVLVIGAGSDVDILHCLLRLSSRTFVSASGLCHGQHLLIVSVGFVVIRVVAGSMIWALMCIHGRLYVHKFPSRHFSWRFAVSLGRLGMPVCSTIPCVVVMC